MNAQQLAALDAESRPDGTFGGARDLAAFRRERKWTREEQDAHWNDLAEAVGAYKDMRPIRRAA